MAVATIKEIPMRSMTVGELLGRELNDVEKRFSPDLLYVLGTLNIPLRAPKVSIVGSRKASMNGISIASKLARKLTENKVVVVSGLADGIDTAAHSSTIESGGQTIAVLGTPLNKTFPAKNFQLQQEIMNHHLAVSQFSEGHLTKPKDFVSRNRTMALISDATIIVEATDKSGSLHQGWEALRLGRSLFIWKSIFDDTSLSWPKKMIEYGAIDLSNPLDILESLPSSFEMPNLFL